jgi:hypothetical protein
VRIVSVPLGSRFAVGHVLSLGRLRPRMPGRVTVESNGLPLVAGRPQRDGFRAWTRRCGRPSQPLRCRLAWRSHREWAGGDTATAELGGWWPPFWPFAIYDIYNYTTRGDGIGFWNYGYGTSMPRSSPYGPEELAVYTGPARTAEDIAGSLRYCNLRRRRAKLPASPSIPSRGDTAERGARRLGRTCRSIDLGRPGFRPSGAGGVHGTGPIGRHAAAHRGDDAGRVGRAAAAGEIL